MTRHITYFIISLITTLNLLADGPPIDSTGKIWCKFISIQLDSSQIKHLQCHRWIKLTADQQKRLNFLELPKYVDIFDPFHNDCICGQVYGMWYLPDRIGFCYKDSTKTIIGEDDEITDWYNNDTNFVGQVDPNHLYIGSNGQLLYKEKPISSNDISKIIESLKTNKDKEYIVIYLPPISNNSNSKAIRKIKEGIQLAIPKDFRTFWM